MFAQTPQKMNYQTVVRNSSNMVLANQNVGIQISILQGSALGTAVYVETQTPTTNANGLASIEIGTGSVVSGDFTTIDWANNTYFIKTEIDIAGGTNYTITGTSQLASVPYALYAASSGSSTPGPQGADGDSAYQIWLAAGNTGTEADFLASLVGADGADAVFPTGGTVNQVLKSDGAGNYTWSNVQEAMIEDTAVTTAKIRDNTITTSDLASQIITSAKMATDAISSVNIIEIVFKKQILILMLLYQGIYKPRL